MSDYSAVEVMSEERNPKQLRNTPPPTLGRAVCRPSSRTTSCGTVPLTSSTQRPAPSVPCMLFFGVWVGVCVRAQKFISGTYFLIC